MRIVTWNIQYGLGRDNRYDLDRIAAVLESADIACLQEVERFWARSGMVDQPEALAALLPGRHFVFGANLDLDASFRDGEGRLVNRRRQYGNAVFSRWPIASARNIPLPKWGTVGPYSNPQGALEAVIAAPSGPVRVYSVHLSYLGSPVREAQARVLLDAVRTAPWEGGAWCGTHPLEATGEDGGWTEGGAPPMPGDAIVAGDLNCEIDSPEYAVLCGAMAKYGRLGTHGQLMDAWVLAGHGEADGATVGNGKRIDHVLVTPGLRGLVREAWIDADTEGSDHQPVWVEVE